jgi:tetratricopeptide (TPR) repeat protein
VPSPASARPGRNDPCPCGSGRKYKHCCEAAARAAASTGVGVAASPTGSPKGTSTDDLLKTAMRLTSAGRVAEAIPFLEQIVRQAPSQAAAHFNLATAYLSIGRLSAAATGFRRATTLKPTYADAHFSLGLTLARLGQPKDAMASLAKVVEIRPRMAEAHQVLGDLQRTQGLASQALQSYRRAAAAAPETTIGRMSRARVLIAEGKPQEAEAGLRRAIAADANDCGLHWLLATVLGEAGRFEDAEASFRRAIELEPGRLEIYRDLLLAKKLQPSDRPLLERLIERVQGRAVGAPAPVELLFAIAKGHDDVGDHEAAMRRFDEANAARRSASTYDRDAHARRVDEVIAAFPAGLLARSDCLGDPDPRPVLILGMPRSGTTLVEQIVSSHPQVVGGGELPFWPSRGRGLNLVALADRAATFVPELAAAYRGELDRLSQTASRITDKNPYNFESLGLIRLAFPNARFIHCSRHPVDTALSIYTTLFATRTDYASDRGDIVFYYRQYLRLMTHWRAVLPAGTLFEAPYEAIVADPEPWSRALVDFCGLEWNDACLRPEANPRAIRTASLWQARQPIYTGSVERWRRCEPWLGELRDLLPKAG